MKKLFALAAVAGMAVFASCGNAEELAKKLADSLRQDSINKANVADSTMKAMSADSAAKAEAEKHAADSTAKAQHEDSVAKKLIK
ncbi:MAG: hypothetical protein Fur0041_08410 [Bacteroidia bacterium]